MSRETWKDVKGYETACRVSDMGSYMKLNPQSGVWNLHRNQDKREERLVKLRTMEGDKICKELGGLILETFAPYDGRFGDERAIVTHLNGKRGDDRLENLAYTTQRILSKNHVNLKRRKAASEIGRDMTKKKTLKLDLELRAAEYEALVEAAGAEGIPIEFLVEKILGAWWRLRIEEENERCS